MSLSPGTRVGSYEIVSVLGAGGMGEVYRARDPRLNRDVAFKILPDAFASDPDRLLRFTREAQTLASLNHPNIAAIYGIEESQNVRALVMELVEGEDLSQRIARGAIPLDETLPLARQIADALEAAHEQGIIHRDLKPANIKVRRDGTVKVLDFGLAKAVGIGRSNADSARATGDASPAATITALAVSERGMILGTPAYMSPEQARGQLTNRSTDVWAFGCVLYEMLAGRLAFPGETQSDVVASVLGREPNWHALPASAPKGILRLLRRCLAKDPRRRLHDIADARLELEEALAPVVDGDSDSHVAIKRGHLVWSALAAAVVGLVGWLAGTNWSATSLPRMPSVIRSTLLLPADTRLTLTSVGSVSISPDGARIVYAAQVQGVNRLFVRDLDQPDAKELAGTDGAIGPFFSPDGQWVGFLAQGSLRKIPVRGGAIETLCEIVPFGAYYGATWSAEDVIYFAGAFAGGISRVPALGGQKEDVTLPDEAKGEIAHLFPSLMPGGKVLLFTVKKTDIESYDDAVVAVRVLGTGEQKTIVQRGSHARYSPIDKDSGYLIYAHDAALFALPFNHVRLEATGPSARVLSNATFHSLNGVAQFSISDTGTLVHATGPAVSDSRLVWVDRKGHIEPFPLRDFRAGYHRISPDGRRLASEKMVANHDIWLYDFARGGVTRLTFNSDSHYPIWSGDATRLAFRSGRQNNLFSVPVDGSAPPEALVRNEFEKLPTSWSADGRWLAFTQVDPKTSDDIWVLSMRDRIPRMVLGTPYQERGAVFDPTARWIAYVSNATGRYEVYVQQFPGPGERWQVSVDGGTEPTWAADGKELFYRSGRRLMSVDIKPGATLDVGRPRTVFEGDFAATPLHAMYDATRDGDRFLMIQNDPPRTFAQLHLVLNWFTELASGVGR
jgi:serine/threonine protein kinase/Tol biopolymer transport system component